MWHDKCLRIVDTAAGRISNRSEITVNQITLKTDGCIHLEREVAPPQILSVLCYQVQLQDGYTLRSFFKMLDKYPVLVKLNDFFPSYLEQCEAHAGATSICESLDSLEFYKTVEMIGVPEKRMEIYNSLTGICQEDRTEIKFMQLTSLLDLPIRLGCLRHVVFGDQVDIFEFETVFTLFELIDGIAWQLSFHGTPQQCELGR